MLDNNSPRTMMLLGAALSGGDVMALAKKMAENNLTPTDSELLLNSEGDSTTGDDHEQVQRADGES